MTRARTLLTTCGVLLIPMAVLAQSTGAVDDTHGKAWRQLDQTTGLAWDAIAQACPRDGLSPCTGSVGGRDLGGWTWATAPQVIELFSYYEPAILTSPSVSGAQYFFSAASFLNVFRATRSFATTYQFANWAGGWTASIDEATGLPVGGGVGYGNPPPSGGFGVTAQGTTTEVSTARGVFLWRSTGLQDTTMQAYDDLGQVPSPAGGVALASVLDNDWLAGAPASAATVTVAPQSSTSAGVTLDPADGSVQVAAGTPAGTYTLVYAACASGNSSACDEATVTVVVNPYVVTAANDQGTASPSTGGTAVASVLANDTLGGAVATPATVTLSLRSSTSAGITLDLSDGSVDVAVGTPVGTHTLVYRICETASPANCAEATVTVVVAPLVVNAVNDQATASSKTGGTAIASVLANDWLGNARATTANVRLSQVSAPIPGITLDLADGSVDVAPKTPSGPYTLVYQICETASPSNCDQATVTLDLSGRSR